METQLAESDVQDQEDVDAGSGDATDSDANIQARAERMGWAPKDQWRGKPEEWKSAKDFIEETESHNGRLRHQLKNMEERLGASERTSKALVERLKEQDKIGYERALADVKAERKRAASVGDVDRVEALDQQEEELRKNPPKDIEQAVKTPKNEDPSVTAWKAKNSWFDRDAGMTRRAIGIYEAYAAENPKASVEEALEATDKEMRERYPEKFENPNRKSAPNMNGGSSLKGGKSGKSWEDIPRSDRQMAQNAGLFEEGGPFKSKDEYAKVYWSNQV